MNTTKHTPGPWRVYNHPGVLGCRDIRAPGRKTGLATTAGLHNDDEDIANAALIAAAPELLEAARYALDCATHKRDGRTLEEMAQRVRELLTDAIAKAEGRS